MSQYGCRVIDQIASEVCRQIDHNGFWTLFVGCVFDSAFPNLLYRCSAVTDWMFVIGVDPYRPYLFTVGNAHALGDAVVRRRSAMKEEQLLQIKWFLLNMSSGWFLLLIVEVLLTLLHVCVPLAGPVNGGLSPCSFPRSHLDLPWGCGCGRRVGLVGKSAFQTD